MTAVSEQTARPAPDAWPVHDVPEGADEARPGIALCLSGGGYRAMLFHVGALWRLNELGLLGRISRVSSVSGGSIAAGILALHWKRMTFGQGAAPEFDEQVVQPIRQLAGRTLDARAIAAGILLPGDIAGKVVSELDRHAFAGATLQDLPVDGPEFVINATNLESGVLFRFSRRRASDYRVGTIANPTLRLAEAVAASAAFPPFLSPLELDLSDAQFEPESGEDLQQPPYTDLAELTDGGVYDNLGLETAFKNFTTVLVSDGGGQFRPDPDPDNDWVRHMMRVLQVMDRQVRSLRKRQLIAAYKSKVREGAYWGIGTNISHYDPPPPALLPAPHAAALKLATLPTRLARLEPELQERLINWGYAVSDAALRTHLDRTWEPPVGYPYPASGIGDP